MKNKKMPFIIKEMNFNGNKYEINGIDLTKAQFYIRKNRELFKIVSPGDYTISNDGTNTYLSLTNSAILTNVISVQVVYFLSISSGKYEPGTEPDINILTANYNKLVEDFKKLWAYIKEQGFTADSALMPLVFPLLGNGETWIFENGEMKATPLVAAETELQKLLDELIKDSQDVLDDYVTTLTNNSKTDINNYTEDKKTEIQEFITENEQDFARKGDILGVLGVEYGGDFGTDLIQIEAGKGYFYKDIATGIETPYVALLNKSGIFITPDIDNFKSLTNRDNLFYEKLDITLPGNEYIKLSNAYILGNMLFIDGFIMNSGALNALANDSTIAVLNLMIPALTNYGIYDATIAGSSLSVYSDFRIKKYLSISVVSGQPFLIVTGLTKGTIS